MSIAFQIDKNVVVFKKIIAIASNAKYLEYNESGSLHFIYCMKIILGMQLKYENKKS